MLGYVALFAGGLLLLGGFAYICRILYRIISTDSNEQRPNGDPLFDKLQANEAEQTLRSGKVLAILIYSVMFFGLIWYLFFQEPAPQHKLTSVDLYNAFSIEKEKALEKYKDQYIVVTGKYVGNDLVYGSPAILLQTSHLSGRVQCNFEGSRAAQTKLFTLGQELSLKGRVLGSRHNVILEKCSLSD